MDAGASVLLASLFIVDMPDRDFMLIVREESQHTIEPRLTAGEQQRKSNSLRVIGSDLRPVPGYEAYSEQIAITRKSVVALDNHKWLLKLFDTPVRIYNRIARKHDDVAFANLRQRYFAEFEIL